MVAARDLWNGTVHGDTTFNTSVGACPLLVWTEISALPTGLNMPMRPKPSLPGLVFSSAPKSRSIRRPLAGPTSSIQSRPTTGLKSSKTVPMHTPIRQGNSTSNATSSNFNPLETRLACNEYPTFDFEPGPEPQGKADLGKTKAIAGNEADIISRLNTSICSVNEGSYDVGPGHPYSASFYQTDPSDSIYVRAGIVWDPRPECASVENGAVSDTRSDSLNPNVFEN